MRRGYVQTRALNALRIYAAVRLSDLPPALKAVQQWEPGECVEDDWAVLGKLLHKVTGKELYDIGGKEESLAMYLKRLEIQPCGDLMARTDEWSNANRDEYRAMIDNLLWDLVVKYECIRAVDASEPDHVKEAMGQEALRGWAHEACQPHCEVANFVSAWKDGRAFTALLNHCYVAWGIRKQTPMERLKVSAKS